MVIKRGGIMPEDIPRPSKSTKQIEIKYKEFLLVRNGENRYDKKYNI